jgi:SGNH hydrolase-like domain, acetyltransferase AlgX
MEGVIAKIRDECLAANVPMFLLVVPSPTDACDNYDASVDPVKYPQYDRVRLSSAVENAAQLAGIAHLNLFPVLRARDANEYYFHGRDDHWNERGQALAATLASEAIVEHSLLSRRK